MYTQRLAAFLLLLWDLPQRVAGLEPELGMTDLVGCENRACRVPTAGNGTCSDPNPSDKKYSNATRATIVGMAYQAVNLTSDVQASLSLVEERQVAFSPGISFYPRTLYAGLPSSKLQNAKIPENCVLMMQYGSQTFPLPYVQSAIPKQPVHRTTGCDDIFQPDCFEKWTRIISSFDPTASTNETTRCYDLASHFNTQIRNSTYSCSGQFFSNLITVNGAPLIQTANGNNNTVALANDVCRPVVDDSDTLYQVGGVETIVEDKEVIGGNIFGGRQGYTPLISTVYGGDNGSLSSVQVHCMQAFRPNGLVLAADNAAASPGRVMFAFYVLTALAVAMVMM
ncbi:hypothetical protein F4778DRAFT_273917 [Xylariomycetidae sp. FL2044]|nr:hypothetical protein F4778DRAFT_273917 [Xylariomycetidae sp. FL2044]